MNTSNPRPQPDRCYSQNALHLVDPLAPNVLVQLHDDTKEVHIQVAQGAPLPKIVMHVDAQPVVLHDPAVSTEKN